MKMNGWTPLFQQIVASSVWGAEDHVRLAWITLLAITGRDGVAHTTVGGLARLANIPYDKAVHAVEVLSSPDLDTLTQEKEGRRIERVSNGYRLINFGKYREMTRKAVVQEQNRVAQEKFREKKVVQEQVVGALERVFKSAPGNRPKSVEEVIEVGKMCGVTEERCRAFWDYYEGSSKKGVNGETVWVMGEKGEKVVGKWQSVLRVWGNSGPRVGKAGMADRNLPESPQPKVWRPATGPESEGKDL